MSITDILKVYVYKIPEFRNYIPETWKTLNLLKIKGFDILLTKPLVTIPKN